MLVLFTNIFFRITIYCCLCLYRLTILLKEVVLTECLLMDAGLANAQIHMHLLYGHVYPAGKRAHIFLRRDYGANVLVHFLCNQFFVVSCLGRLSTILLYMILLNLYITLIINLNYLYMNHFKQIYHYILINNGTERPLIIKLL
ncbi:hypothetical protein ACJX0J_035621 [Zea mays]